MSTAFERARRHLEALASTPEGAQSLQTSHKLELYGLFKQATEVRSLSPPAANLPNTKAPPD